MSTYTFRICAALAGQEAIEVFRCHRNFQWADWRFWTARPSDSALEYWVEQRTADARTITRRPVIRHHSGSDKHAIHLTHEQKKAAGVSL